MFKQTFKNIDDKLWKDAGCSSELDYVEQTLAMSLRGGFSSRRSNLLVELGIASHSVLATTYEKTREHLMVAKEMIAKMGYHRRDKEVEELEMLIVKRWSPDQRIETKRAK